MQYAEVTTLARVALVSLEPTNFGRPYKELFDQTDLSGAEVFASYSHDNFSNPFQRADEQRYSQMSWWAEIFRDIVREGGKGTDNKNRLNVKYVSNADTQWEKIHDVWAPKNGWYVPTEDGIFVPGTLIPFETVDDKNIAIKKLEAKGMPKEQVSYFYRLENYRNNERFVGRGFLPDLVGVGRFDVLAGRLPSFSGRDWVGSRPAYGKADIVMKVTSGQPANVE